MSNSYFQFKQFLVQQDKAAMKVSTDACIQGAWTPVAKNVKNVLDVGAGTGLLSLMLAQRNSQILVDAIELDAQASQQAQENFQASPWSDRISLLQGDVRSYCFDKLYDLIICNPPFFQNSLLGADADRNNVRHTLTLSYDDLFEAMKRTLNPIGYASVMLPSAEHVIWEELLAKNNWIAFKKLMVKPKDSFAPNRIISLCTADKNKMIEADETLCIYNEDNTYTDDFSKLLSPFYLKL
jgi:tRNA1Val (adenine37-N6)-methyltransferase